MKRTHCNINIGSNFFRDFDFSRKSPFSVFANYRAATDHILLNAKWIAIAADSHRNHLPLQFTQISTCTKCRVNYIGSHEKIASNIHTGSGNRQNTGNIVTEGEKHPSSFSHFAYIAVVPNAHVWNNVRKAFVSNSSVSNIGIHGIIVIAPDENIVNITQFQRRVI